MIFRKRMVSATRACALFAFVALINACGDGPQVPTTFAPVNGSITQVSGVVATVVNAAPQVKILDAKSKPIKGHLVRWRIGANGGHVVNDSSFTDASGVALSGGWTLGTSAGIQTLTASSDGVSPITFTAQVSAGAPTDLVRLSVDGQVATVNTVLPIAPSVRAQDAFGNPVAGVAVTFATINGGGVIEGGQQITDANGVAAAASWKLGTVAGRLFAVATAPNVSQAAFSAVALPGPAADLQKVFGDSQQGVSGLAITVAPAVRVVDAFSNPIGNVAVTFTTGLNSGTVTPSIAQTDAVTGIAFVTGWILGNAPTQTLVATSSSVTGKSVTFTATAVTTLYGITVRYVGTLPSAAQQAAVNRSVAKWRSIVLSNSGTTRFTTNAGACGRPWMPAVDTTVTNLVIYANIGPIDGVGNVLGNANACGFHATTGLTGFATMQFDSADLDALDASGLTDAVITHEIGHALGIGGSAWTSRGLLTDGGLPDPIFTGTQARAQFVALGGGAFTGRIVPVENTGGAGTRDVHWRETVFRNELMTGFVNTGLNPLSRVTIGALADIGYAVNYSAADSYTFVSFLRSPFEAAERVIELGDDVVPIPANGYAKANLIARQRP